MGKDNLLPIVVHNVYFHSHLIFLRNYFINYFNLNSIQLNIAST